MEKPNKTSSHKMSIEEPEESVKDLIEAFKRIKIDHKANFHYTAKIEDFSD